MLSYRRNWEFVSTLEKCAEALGCASCYSTLLSCTHKFPRASTTQIGSWAISKKFDHHWIPRGGELYSFIPKNVKVPWVCLHTLGIKN